MTGLYVAPREKPRREDCLFYHAMTFPNGDEVAGNWDLRGRLGDYLGGLDAAGKRVLDIGPASGFIAFELERSGAEVVVAEVDTARRYRGVPYHDRPATRDRRAYQAQKEAGTERMKNGFWYAWHAYRSRVKAHYGDLYDLPAELGAFDVALLLAILTHNRDPIGLIESAARRTRERIVITETFAPGDGAHCRILPDPAAGRYTENWFQFTLPGLEQILRVMGFAVEHVSEGVYAVPRHAREIAMTTVVARRVAGDLW